MVHWCYYPDRLLLVIIMTHSLTPFIISYNSVIPIGELGMGMGMGPEVIEIEPPKQWHLGPQWLDDSDLFNEWMNEEDYEIKQVMKTGLYYWCLKNGSSHKQSESGQCVQVSPLSGFSRRRVYKLGGDEVSIRSNVFM